VLRQQKGGGVKQAHGGGCRNRGGLQEGTAQGVRARGAQGRVWVQVMQSLRRAGAAVC
jgi:hypothetical protein